MILWQLHPEPLSQLDCIWDTLYSFSLCSARSEYQSAKLVVIRKHLVNWVVHMVVIFGHILNDLDFCGWIWVIKNFIVVCNSCRCPSPVYIFSDFTRHSNWVRDLTQTSSRHLSWLAWRILLFRRVTALEHREGWTGCRWIQRLSSFIFAIVASSCNLMSLCLAWGYLGSRLALYPHRWFLIIPFWLFFITAGDTYRKITFDSLSLLWRGVHSQSSGIGDDHDYILS